MLLFWFAVSGNVSAEEDHGTYATVGDATAADIAVLAAGTGLEGLPIDFEEFDLGTVISDQYAPLGAIFDGDNPTLTYDETALKRTNPSTLAPVLDGQEFTGSLECYFIEPATEEPYTASTVDWFVFYGGVFNEYDSTVLEWFDIDGRKLGEYSNITVSEVEEFYIEYPGIASFKISSYVDTDGFEIDDLNFGSNDIYPDFSGDDGLDECASPETELEYSFCFYNDTDETYEDAIIVVTFDEGIYYPYSEQTINNDLTINDPDPNYDSSSHSYTIFVGDIDPEDTVCYELPAIVTEDALPGLDQICLVELTANFCENIYYDPNDPNAYTTECEYEVVTWGKIYTDVCCWADDSSIVYVDANAKNSRDSGVSWDNAFCGTDGLQKALDYISKSPCSSAYSIYVASGTYYPGTEEDDSFVIPDNTELYGGFPKGGCDFEDRNPKKYQPILTGQVDDDSDRDINSVVTMGNETILDSFIVENAYKHNIYSEGVDFSLKNCQIIDSGRYGIYALAGNIAVKSCKISSNKVDGIYHEGEGFNINVYNSWIVKSGENGIFTYDSILTAKNNIISESNSEEQNYNGIRLFYPSDTPSIVNCTISNNIGAGLLFIDSGTIDDPNDYPSLVNNIIYYNNDGGTQVSGIDVNDYASYCCIQGCDDTQNNNISLEPMFAYTVDSDGTPSTSNYHISYNSRCKDSGDPDLDYSDQTDYDSESREIDTADIGADEVYSCDGSSSEDDIYNSLDWNDDGLVNLEEFQVMSEFWLSRNPYDPEIYDPNISSDPNALDGWNDLCNLDETGDSTYYIDLADFEAFLADDVWLWEACWYQSSQTVETSIETTTASTASVSLLSASSTMATMATTASTLSYVEDTAEDNINPYSGLTNTELSVLVQGIYELEDSVQEQLDSGCEDSEDLTEILDFFDDILLEIQDYLIESEE